MLEQTLTIRNIELATRLVMAPTNLRFAEKGFVNEEHVAYYDSRTRGGYVGLVVVEHTFVLPNGQASEHQLGSCTDDYIPGLAKIAQVIQKNGSKAVLQLSHTGASLRKDVVPEEGISPSGLVSPNDRTPKDVLQNTHAMTLAEIQQLIEAFVAAALRARKAGFDGVEIHSAHGYLLNQFYSPITNHRTDEYTGSTIEGRTLLQRQILQAVRKAVGETFIVGLRLGASDYWLTGGSTIEDGAEAAKLIETAGADYISVTGGLCFYTLPGRTDAGYFRDASEAIEKVVHIPVILTGGIWTRQAAEDLLAAGQADLIGAARPFLKDAGFGKMMLG